MIDISIDKTQLESLRASLGEKASRLPRELKTVVNKVAEKVALEAARDLVKVVPLKVGTLKKIVKQKTKADAQKAEAVVGVGGGYPIPLKMFKPTQLKRGVTVKMRRGMKRSVVRDAFIVKRYGNRVYKRKTKARAPLVQQYGPKPGDLFTELRIIERSVKLAEEQLVEEMNRRIRSNVLKFTNRH